MLTISEMHVQLQLDKYSLDQWISTRGPQQSLKGGAEWLQIIKINNNNNYYY